MFRKLEFLFASYDSSIGGFFLMKYLHVVGATVKGRGEELVRNEDQK